MMPRTVLIVMVVVVLLAGIAAACALTNKRSGENGIQAVSENGIQLTSLFADDGKIPVRYTCDGEDMSPPLTWSGIPQGGKSLALIVEDPDAPGGTFIHWVLVDIPPDLSGLEEGVEKAGSVPGVGVQGKNDFNQLGYNGPCPPLGSQHRYIFTLYALDQQLGLQPGVTASDLKTSMQGHILAQGELTGNFGR